MSTLTNFTQYTNNWKQESVLNLANHFHKLNANQDQQLRLSEYVMNANDLILFNAIVSAGEITRLEMHLGLVGSANSSQFTSCFYMCIWHGAGDTKEYFRLDAREKQASIPENDLPDSDIVPDIFKEMIANNWDEMGHSLIDDLFSAKDGNQLKRVNYFLIGDLMRDFIRDLLDGCNESINEVKIYAGVDLNKFTNKEMISFTPVLGIKLPSTTLPLMVKGGNVNCLKGEVLIEYSMPCPPACKPPPSNL